MRWWSALALLRCLASSPAAAERPCATGRRSTAADSTDEVDAIADPASSTPIRRHRSRATTPRSAPTPPTPTQPPTPATRRRLRDLAAMAAALKGPKADAKLKRLITADQRPARRRLPPDRVLPLHPHRRLPRRAPQRRAGAKEHPGCGSRPSPGRCHPRNAKPASTALTDHDGPRVLVATDCLSEGVNLQDGFTAVVHYDLAWNPTRHEQREGRVDRFGQHAATVRAVTYYGEDNGIDGIVLDVLIRRHENIRRSTGVSVPVPVDSTTVMKAIWESLLLRGKQADQLTLDFGAATSSLPGRRRWRCSGPTPPNARRRPAHGSARPACSPTTSPPTLDEVRRSLGGPADAETFTRDALALLPAQLADTADGFTARIDTVPPALRDQLPPAKEQRLHFHRSLPVPPGAQRADPHRPHRRGAVALRPGRRAGPRPRPGAATGPPRRR